MLSRAEYLVNTGLGIQKGLSKGGINGLCSGRVIV